MYIVGVIEFNVVFIVEWVSFYVMEIVKFVIEV